MKRRGLLAGLIAGILSPLAAVAQSVLTAGGVASKLPGGGPLTSTSTGVLTASGSFTVAAGSTADVVIAGLSFQPTLILFYSGGDALFGVFNGNTPPSTFPSSWDKYACFGAANATNQFSCSIAGRWGDGRRDGGTYMSTVVNFRNYTDSGLVMRRKTINSDGFTLAVDSAAEDNTSVVTWVAFGGTLTATIDCIRNVAAGSYTVNAGFAPSAFIVPMWRQAYQTGNGLYPDSPYPTLAPGTNFVQEYATAGVSLSFTDTALNAAGVSGHVAYGGALASGTSNWSMPTNRYGIFGSGFGNFENSIQTRGNVTSFSGNNVNFTISAADTTNILMPYIIIGGCKTFVTQAAMHTSPGAFNITGAPFQPVAALLGSTPNVATNGTSITSVALNGDHNVSLGYVTATGQGGFSYFDAGGYTEPSTPKAINPVYTYYQANGVDPAFHNANFDVFTGACLRGKVWNAPADPTTSPGTFSTRGEVQFTSFLVNGMQMNQTNAAAVAGKIAVLMIGNP